MVISLRDALTYALMLADDDLAIALAVPDTSGADGAGVHGTLPSGSPRDPGPDHDSPEALRLRALVELAVGGDAEAFGQLYDHYMPGIYRFIYYRVGSVGLAEDLTSDTFVRALRAIQNYSWQGKDFGAWLTTIARNLIIDHFKSSRSRREQVTDTIADGPTDASGPEQDVLEMLSNESLLTAVNALQPEQRDCILMRFMQGLSITETAMAMSRTEGAVKQLQLRAIRNLAKTVQREM